MTTIRAFTWITAFAVVASTASLAQAFFTLTATAGTLRNSDGSELITEGAFAFIADTDADGFGNFTDPTTYASSDSDDVTLGVFKVNNGFGAGNFSGTFGQFEAEEGVSIIGVFYDNVFDEEQAGPSLPTDGPGQGIDFGILDPEFTLPTSNGSGINWTFTSTEFFGQNSPEALFASDGTTVPEPGTATAMIAALGGLVMMSRRRRSA